MVLEWYKTVGGFRGFQKKGDLDVWQVECFSILQAKVPIFIPFLELEKAPARKKSMHFGANVWIFMPFLVVLGAALKKSVHFKA